MFRGSTRLKNGRLLNEWAFDERDIHTFGAKNDLSFTLCLTFLIEEGDYLTYKKYLLILIYQLFKLVGLHSFIIWIIVLCLHIEFTIPNQHSTFMG